MVPWRIAKAQDTLDFLAEIETANRGIKRDSFEYTNYYHRGMFHYYLGFYQKAKLDFEHTLELVKRKPNKFPTEKYIEHLHMAYFVLGLIEAYHSKQNDKAIVYLENAIDIDPSRFRPYGVLGEIYMQQGDSTLACRYFKLAFRNKGLDEYALPEICKE